MYGKTWANLYYEGGVYDEYRYKNLRDKYEQLKQSEITDCFKMLIRVHSKLDSNKKNIKNHISGLMNSLENQSKRHKELSDSLENLGLKQYLIYLDTYSGRNKLQNIINNPTHLKHMVREDREEAITIIKYLLESKQELIKYRFFLNEKINDIKKIESRSHQVEEEIFMIFKLSNISAFSKKEVELHRKYEEYISTKEYGTGVTKARRDEFKIKKRKFNKSRQSMEEPPLFSFENQLLKLHMKTDQSSMKAVRSLNKNLAIIDNLIYINRNILKENYREIDFLQDDIKIQKLIKATTINMINIRNSQDNINTNLEYKQKKQNLIDRLFDDIRKFVPNTESQRYKDIESNVNKYIEKIENNKYTAFSVMLRPIMGNIKSDEKSIDILNQYNKDLRQENDKLLIKKYAVDKQMQYYSAATNNSSVETLRNLYLLNNSLSKYIDKKSTFFTRLLERFCNPNKKFGKYSIFKKAYYISMAKRERNHINELIKKSKENWSINQMNDCRGKLMNYMKIARAELESNDSAYWHESHQEVLSIFKILDNAGSNPSNDTLQQDYSTYNYLP